MIKTRLKLGDKLELEINDEAYKIEQPLVSQFDSQFPDGTMEILSPIYRGRVLYIAPNTKIDVIYQHEGSLYKFGAVALVSRFLGRIGMLRIKPVSEEVRIQRRNFFRIACVLDIEYRLYEEKNTPEMRGDFKKGLTKDISGGGICLLMNERPEPGCFLEGKLNIGQEIAFTGKVLRVMRTENNEVYSYETSLEFTGISEKAREKLISFIYDYQRRLLKKGWYTK